MTTKKPDQGSEEKCFKIATNRKICTIGFWKSNLFFVVMCKIITVVTEFYMSATNTVKKYWEIIMMTSISLKYKKNMLRKYTHKVQLSIPCCVCSLLLEILVRCNQITQASKQDIFTEERTPDKIWGKKTLTANQNQNLESKC